MFGRKFFSSRRPSQKDAVDVLVVAGGTLGAGRHLEGAQEARDQRLQLVHVLLLGLNHAKHEAE